MHKTQSETLIKLAKAMVSVQKTELFALKGSENPFFKSKYADLSSCWAAARQPLTDNGLCVIQTTEKDDMGVVLNTMLLHESGEWIRGSLRIRPDKNTPQAIGSAITYARRYALSSIIGLCPEDDDAEQAEGRLSKGQVSKAKGRVMKTGGGEWTDKQRKAIFAMGKKSELSSNEIKSFVEWFGGGAEKLSKNAASQLIEHFDEHLTGFVKEQKDKYGGYVPPKGSALSSNEIKSFAEDEYDRQHEQDDIPF